MDPFTFSWVSWLVLSLPILHLQTFYYEDDEKTCPVLLTIFQASVWLSFARAPNPIAHMLIVSVVVALLAAAVALNNGVGYVLSITNTHTHMLKLQLTLR